MDLFDLGEGFSSLVEGVARVQCPTLVSYSILPGLHNYKTSQDFVINNFGLVHHEFPTMQWNRIQNTN